MGALKRALASLVLVLCTGTAWACGPGFPYAYIAYGDELSVLRLPCMDFGHELETILGLSPPVPVPYNPSAPKETWKTRDAAELGEALRAQGVAEPEAIVASYLAFREETRKYSQHRGHLRDSGLPASLCAEPFRLHISPIVSDAPVRGYVRLNYVSTASWDETLEKVPAEFAFYARGAAAYTNQDWNTAVSWWRQLLALPAEQRPYRSVWAAFMIARVQAYPHPDKSYASFGEAVALVDAGFRDSWKLAGTASVWRAGMASERGDRVATVHHLADMYRLGGGPEKSEAFRRLKVEFGEILTSYPVDPVEPEVARDPLCRRLITAWLISYHGYDDGDERLTRWLEAMRRLPSDTPIEGADHLAWLAYHVGDMKGAAAWADLAGPDALAGQWVKSKLLLREGKSREATAILSRISKAFPDNVTGVVVDYTSGMVSLRSESSEDLGILLLARKDYAGALDALLRSDYWLDAAYVAERVLTLEELKKYVDSLGPAAEEPPDTPGHITSADQIWQNAPQQKVRSLLGRRLARAGRYEEAKGCVDRDTRVLLDTLIGHFTQSKIRRSKEERAEALIQAAEHVREHGFEMMSTELDPDWHYFDGYLEMESTQERRFEQKDRKTEYEQWAAMGNGRLLGPRDEQPFSPALLRAVTPSQDEWARVEKSAPSPDKRFHYRYVASEMMWEAARLLPDNDMRTARALYLGGTYLAKRDPGAADRFYKALVRRCGELEVGKQADARHWFPESLQEGDG